MRHSSLLGHDDRVSASTLKYPTQTEKSSQFTLTRHIRFIIRMASILLFMFRTTSYPSPSPISRLSYPLPSLCLSLVVADF